jgi:outer membrane receptor for monomeric catechols
MFPTRRKEPHFQGLDIKSIDSHQSIQIVGHHIIEQQSKMIDDVIRNVNGVCVVQPVKGAQESFWSLRIRYMSSNNISLKNGFRYNGSFQKYLWKEQLSKQGSII